ncbi:MAG: DNA-3-methyladenine glycosylase [Patescibacteria group bacterium]
MRRILPQKFFNQPALKIAEFLLGKFLVRKYKGKEITLMITEVEAYDGFEDRASHAAHGKTERNKIMFEKGGKWYVYFTYGMHWMLNIVVGPKDYPAAILIRGAGDINGPAKLTKHLKINKKFNGLKADRKCGLWIEDRGIKISKSKIANLKRVGVEYAGAWARKPYRFMIK